MSTPASSLLSQENSRWSPGSLVHARGREWLVLSGSNAEVLRLRPVSGSEEDQTWIDLSLEAEPVKDASFPTPDPSHRAGQDTALLLRDALLLSLRRGAGPFRSFGQIAVEPRAYQLVPLLMALKLDPVRLLIADDVGIGKTIEAALIAREFLDRGEVERFTVLCPPHLSDQWVSELESRFHLRAVAVTAASAARLERELPPGESIFTAHPYTVVSLDYIKSDRRRDEFFRSCPEMVIVDEAHTCSATGQGRHQRYELLKGLAEDPRRHLIMLSATPHSGDETAYFRLLGLLNPDFAQLEDVTGDEHATLRAQLAAHFVQRRRADIDEWQDGSIFPRRQTKELTYRLGGAWEAFFNEVLDYCAAVVAQAGDDSTKQRLNFWGTLALMRCVASSPAAAVLALRTRAGLDEPDSELDIERQIFDGSDDSLSEDDLEPPALSDAALADQKALDSLITQASALSGQKGDPKLKLLANHLSELIDDGFNPVVFCRYIATAHYLGQHLKKRFKKLPIAVVTGELTPDERKEQVALLGQEKQRLLVATDCLSEGINLQEHFDAVVHYDLSWNPTRHEQREGRVDRFGQTRPVVRATLLYGANNPVDGAVLEVILRKAGKIREELGVPVPLPDEGHTLSQALMKAVLLRSHRRGSQQTFDFAELEEAKAIEARWQDSSEKAKKNRTVFAQRRLKPEDVLPEWRKSLVALGGQEDVQRFSTRALSRLGAGLEKIGKAHTQIFKAPLGSLPDDVRERLELEGLEGTIRVDFNFPPAPSTLPLQRSHPLISVLAETLLERTLSSAPRGENLDLGDLGRVGCWVAEGVETRTVIALLRLRHQIGFSREGKQSTLLVEEANALAFAPAHVLEGEDALSLLAAPPVKDPPSHVRERMIQQALSELKERRAEFDAYAEERAKALLSDHRRVREAGQALGRYSVKALLPADIIGLFVLLPKVD